MKPGEFLRKHDDNKHLPIINIVVCILCIQKSFSVIFTQKFKSPAKTDPVNYYSHRHPVHCLPQQRHYPKRRASIDANDSNAAFSRHESEMSPQHNV